MNEAIIQVDGVTKRYGTLAVLNGIDLSVPAGRFAAVIGKSGSGKSTLLGVVSGLEKADSGRVLIQGHDLSQLDEPQMADLRRQTIGIVFQSFNLIPSLSALENVLLPTFFEKEGTAADRRKRATDLLAQVGLGDRMHHRPSQLSGGEQQRVAIARALVNRPAILLADEPTGNLDAETGAGVLGLLLDMSRIFATTLLIVTHDLDVAGKADMTIEMKDGRIQHGNA
ncbi:MAG: ABC transporter ATP-binding protein [Rhodoplanes sp.]|uniref:ABC transporter ATP-binding protein n=1 Tax=Rhodoplanes sp. TaxID=1968906 RepID=UPI0017F090AC|nr:ABC transporter ATP-binding protein [Rhodoplanes sp.]NVO15923.1 ABC transporter ATP-binding protein [Rhodoplanes sp.]